MACVQALLREGAAVNACVRNSAQSGDGRFVDKSSALDLAQQARQRACVQTLEQAGGKSGVLLPDSSLGLAVAAPS